MSGRIAVGDANTLGQITQQSMRMPDDGFFYVNTTTLSARSYYFDKLTIKRWKFDSSYVLQSETLEMSIPRARDSGPQVRVKYDYYPYGMLWKNPDLQDEESRLHDHAYQDKEFLFGEYDGTVGLALYDFHARMYDPATGRWLVPDPAAQFANPYLAMGNNPVSMIDPTGTMAWDDIAETDNDAWLFGSDFDPEKPRVPKHRKVGSAKETEADKKFSAECLALEMLQSDFDQLQSFDQSHLISDTDPPGSSNGSTLSWSPRMIYNHASSSNETNWFNPSGKVGWSLGIAATAAEFTPGSFRISTTKLGISPKFYPNGWTGNPYTNTYSIGKIGSVAGKSLLGFSVLYDLKGTLNYLENPNSSNAVHPAKFGLNTAMAYIGLRISPPAGIAYSGVETFFPGGWFGDQNHKGALWQMDNIQRYNQNILGPQWRLIPFNKN